MPVSVADRFLQMVKIPAYQLCGIPPYQVGDLTPADLWLMLYVMIPPEQRQKEIMDDDMMETMVSGLLHPVINACGGRR